MMRTCTLGESLLWNSQFVAPARYSAICLSRLELVHFRGDSGSPGYAGDSSYHTLTSL